MSEAIITPAPQLSEVIEECQQWLTSVLSGLFYINKEQASALPKIYMEWLNHVDETSSIQPVILTQLKRSASSMMSVFDAARTTVPPKQDQFELFMEAFEDFMRRLAAVEKQTILTDHGIDSETGFKTSAVLIEELKKELDRRSRRGNPFSIAFVKIDDDGADSDVSAQLETIGEAFRRCLRSFDDIYRAGQREFVIGLKHADKKGGLRFTERVKDELKTLNANFTFSSCVAEPDPADDMVSFLDNMRNDLARVTKIGKGQVIELEELSPLQRYVNSIQTK